MSRLDRHVSAVRSRLATTIFLEALAWSSTGVAGVAVLGILVARFTTWAPPKPMLWLAAAGVAAVVAAVSYMFMRRPSELDSAVAIDEKLSLKEKFSTALSVRGSADPFARAAVLDAEKTADNVSLHRQFPIRFPRGLIPAVVAGVLAMFALMLPQYDPFGRQAAVEIKNEEARQKEDARQAVERALARVNAAPRSVADDEAIQLAKRDLESLLKQGVKDPGQARRSAIKALQDMDKALKDQIKNNKKFAAAKGDEQMVRQLNPPKDSGPVADAHRELARGDFKDALAALDETAKQFDEMDQAEKQKAADQMQELAKQLQKISDDPKQAEAREQQLKQLGANDQQAQQINEMMQKAAAGDKAAAEQLQNEAKKLMDQMNNGEGATPQQQQAIQDMVKQMQNAANAQEQADAMAKAAQQMADAMKQAAKKNQPGGQEMQPGTQAMQRALEAMQGNAEGAQELADAQQAAMKAAQDAANAARGGKGEKGPGGKLGEFEEGDPEGKEGKGGGGAGQGAGERPKPEESPFGTQDEVSASQENETGRDLAVTWIKDRTGLKGESKETFKEAIESAEHEATDEVDNERVGRAAQKVVKDYFNSMQKDAQ